MKVSWGSIRPWELAESAATAPAQEGTPPSRSLARVKSAARVVVERLQMADPTRLVPPPSDAPLPAIGFASVYRRRHSPRVRALLDQLPEGAVVRLWALDEVDEGLRAQTVGRGPGGRPDLLNRLVESMEDEGCDLLVIADDDFSIVIGDLPRLLRFGYALRFDLFQPAHTRRSRAVHRVTWKRFLAIARETTFVEQGPLIILSRKAQQRLLPFPDDYGMGWGLEVRWHQFASQLRFGVVDAVAIRHDRSGPYGYDTVPERARLLAELERAGLRHLTDIQRQTTRHGVLPYLRRRGRAAAPPPCPDR